MKNLLLCLCLFSSVPSFAALEVVDAGSKFEFDAVEKIELSKTASVITLNKWNGEEKVVMDCGVDSVPIIEDKKVKWKTSKKEIHAYLLDLENFELEIVLNEAPASNQFDFLLTGWENFNFFYQPPLTQEEIDIGRERPENVVGSYAVYHKTKRNHVIGMTNYETGKAFHIYRPKAVDADGNETWAELSFKDGVLSVIVPQAFLDTAVYPVKIDPTFGYTTAGASFQTIRDTPCMGRDIITEDGIGTSMTLRISSTGDHLVKCNIYLDESGEPDTNTPIYANNATTQEKTVGTPDNGTWVTFNFIGSPLFVHDNFYRLTAWANTAGTTLACKFDTSGGLGLYTRSATLTYGAWPAQSGTMLKFSGDGMSLYVTYTPVVPRPNTILTGGTLTGGILR